MTTIYRVKSTSGHTAWASSESNGKKARMQMCAECGLQRKDVEVEPMEITTSKAGVIEFLNAEVPFTQP